MSKRKTEKPAAPEERVTEEQPKAEPVDQHQPLPSYPHPAEEAIAAIQADPDYVHQSAEGLEVRAIRWLVERGHDAADAERAVRLRLTG